MRRLAGFTRGTRGEFPLKELLQHKLTPFEDPTRFGGSRGTTRLKLQVLDQR